MDSFSRRALPSAAETPADASVPARHAKIAPFLPVLAVMDIEHINQIGNTLADLSARTDALRGYL